MPGSDRHDQSRATPSPQRPGVGAVSPFPGADPRLATLGAMVARIEGATRKLARLATGAAVIGGAGGLLLWWATAGHMIGGPGEDKAVSLLVLALCLAPGAWLVNVGASLRAVLELPAKLTGVAVRGGARFLGAPPRSGPPAAGRLATVRSLRGMVRDYGDMVGSWATVAQLVTPTFWVLTVFALVAVPIVVAVALVAGLVEAFA